MNAINLLPEKHRPRKRSTGKTNSGYIALGVLGLVLVGLLGYVLTLNSINSSKTKITEATAEAARLNEEANSLGSYGDFAKIKAERTVSSGSGPPVRTGLACRLCRRRRGVS